MTETRIMMVGVEDPDTNEWVELPESNMICHDCEIFRNRRVKMRRLENGDLKCPVCGVTVLKFTGSEV